MKKKMKPVHFLILFLLVVLTICAAFSSRILGLYYQIEGGNLLTKVLKEAYPEQPDAIPCTLAPLTDPNWREQTAKAIDDLEKALKYDPSLAQAALLAGRGYCLLGEATEAVGAYLHFTNIHPDNPLGYLELGFTFEKECNYVETGNIPGMKLPNCEDISMQEAMVRNWGSAGLKYADFLAAADQYQRISSNEAALHWVVRAAAFNENVISCYYYIASQVVDDDGLSQKFLNNAIEQDKGWCSSRTRYLGWYRWGIHLYNDKQWNQAKFVLEKAIQLFVADQGMQRQLSENYRYLGLTYWALDDLNTARENLLFSVKENPTNPWAHFHYGKLIFLDLGDVEGAQNELLLALNLMQNDVNAWKNLIEFWNDNYVPGKAKEICLKAKNQSVWIELSSLCKKVDDMTIR